MASQTQPLRVALISDSAFAMPTAVTLTSLKANKKQTSRYEIYVIDAGLESEDKRQIFQLSSSDFRIAFKEPTRDITSLHTENLNSKASATSSALYKFLLPEILLSVDRLLYIDSDMVVREDLSWLVDTDFDEKIVMAVAEAAQIYNRERITCEVGNYFNSGFLYMDLKAFREQALAERLVLTKGNMRTGNLVDQDAFNIVLDGKVKYLDIRYNCLSTNLSRVKSRLAISELNSLYSSSYRDLDEIFQNAAIIHFGSKDKPWRFSDVPFWDEWLRYFHTSPFHRHLRSQEETDLVSIIVPVYNISTYLPDCLESLIRQNFQNIEIICVNDGATDRSQAVIDAYKARDPRVVGIQQENQGQSAARNSALKIANGEFIHFMDGDDILSPRAYERLIPVGSELALDIAFFDAESFFDKEFLREEFSSYEDYYERKLPETSCISGIEMLRLMRDCNGFRASVCIQIFRKDFLVQNNIRFFENMVFEDNAFSLQAIVEATSCKYIQERFYFRRIREGSTITSNPGAYECASLISVAVRVFEISSDPSLPTDIRQYCQKLSEGFVERAHSLYNKLDPVEQSNVQFNLPGLEQLFLRIIRHKAERVGAAGTLSSDATRTYQTARLILLQIKQKRQYGSPVTALKTLRALHAGLRGLILETAYAETASFLRRLRNGFRNIYRLLSNRN
ncbi:MAG: glycosyltransferase [Pseudomonadota bacterium]